MPAEPGAPVYLILHVPKTAGQTIQYHLAEHCRPGAFWSPPRGLLRWRMDSPDNASAVRAVSSHDLRRSHERLFAGRDIRRIALLREPLSLQLSLYNYRMMNHLAKGLGTYSFAVHLRAQPRDFIAHWLLARWLEIPWPRVMAMSDEAKYRLLNEALAQFWFVGDYTDCDRVIATLAGDLGVPAAARPRNTAGQWHRQIKWQPLTAAALPTELRQAVRAQNPLDEALWQSWREAGFDTASVLPAPLRPRPRIAFLAHEAARPAYLVARWLQRDAAPRLPLARRSGLRSGIARADKARDAGDWALAARHYRQALSEEPELPAIWVQLGHMQKLLGDLAGAEAAYRESLRVEPDNPDTHLQLGHLLRLRGAAASAEAAYRAALAIDPNFAAAQEALNMPELATARAPHERAVETREAAG